jgi:hypothetical protein
MSDTVTEQEFARITGMETGPAVWLPGWLPDLDVFPELTEARAQYLRLRDVWSAAGQRQRDLEAQIEASKEQREASLRDAILAGDDGPQAEGDAGKLTAEVAEAKEHTHAASSAFLSHINSTIALVIEHRQEWLGAITAFNESVEDEIAAVVAQARELRNKFGNYWRLQHWIHRTAVDAAEMPAYHFPFAEIGLPLSGDPAEEAARLRGFMEASYAGGIAPDKPGTEAQARELERRNDAARRQRPTVTDDEDQTVELSDLDDDELVDWLMGCGRFDGQPKPPAAQVVSAAEGEADMAARLIQAERVANAEAPRPDVLEPLSEITTSRKATV